MVESDKTNQLTKEEIVANHLAKCMNPNDEEELYTKYMEESGVDKQDKMDALFNPKNMSSVAAAIRASAFALAGQDIPTEMGISSNIPTLDPLCHGITRQMTDVRLFQRPARQQISLDEINRPGYNQGDESFNIWYGKYATDRAERFNPAPVPAPYKCKPIEDVGYTAANYRNDYVCLYFARGSCAWGHKCTYLHHIPGEDEEVRLAASIDVFGRQRHAYHKDDRQGVGSFLEESKTLYVGGLGWGEAPEEGKMDLSDSISEQLIRCFSEMGLLEDVRLVKRRGLAFVKYKYRVSAEFAREAMHAQSIEEKTPSIIVRWAFQDQEMYERAPRQRNNAERERSLAASVEPITAPIPYSQPYRPEQLEEVQTQIEQEEAKRSQDNLARILARIDHQISSNTSNENVW